MGVLWNTVSANSNGGTELLCRRLEASLPKELLDDVQIVPSRLHGELDPTKVRILYLHDLPHDPESQKILRDDGWRKFHKIVCVSNWQMQLYMQQYQIPWSHMMVIPNSILPIARDTDQFWGETIRFVYHTTPHRGLDILYAVFEKLHETHPNIHLDVFSSFKAYGWADNDKPFEALFEKIEAHPAMTYHGFQPNDHIRAVLANADVFAYPCIWPETSCLALMEAMSAGLLCVHPNFGALYETAANWTMMYQFHEDKTKHSSILYGLLNDFLSQDKELIKIQLQNQKAYADIFYNWNTRQKQWVDLIEALRGLPREMPERMFTYRVGSRCQ
jgi:glycosyltransferase involved in cell wall biosynthesis